MPRAIITLAVDLERAGEADRIRRLLVSSLAGRGDVRVTKSTVAVDESLAVEDLDT